MEDPVVPLLLEKARADGIRHAWEEEESKNHPRFVPPQPGTDKMEKVKMIAPPDRPMIKFVDIGGKFINKHESLKRAKIAAHRGALKAKRRKEVIADERRRIQEELLIRDAVSAAAEAEKKKKKKEELKWQPGDGRSLVLS
jgi:hypothetical protein